MQRRLWSLLAVALLVLAPLVGCSQPTAPASATQDDYDLGKVGDFSLTERSGQIVRRDDLLGKVWVAAFVFTRCSGPCTQVSGSMAHLQHDLAEQDDVRLLSFTVDPAYDTPEILSNYAKRFGAEPNRWLFLTGDPDTVAKLIRYGFYLHAERKKDAPPGNEVEHDTRLAVVDRRGHLRGYFDGTDPEAIPRLEAKVKALLQEKP